MPGRNSNRNVGICESIILGGSWAGNIHLGRRSWHIEDI